MNREIQWKGNEHTNSSSRTDNQGVKHVPFVIVNHISVGTMESMDEWFTSPGNKSSSANYGVAKDGRIHQYVDIRRMAWANGIGAVDIAASKTPVVHDHPGINPNLYSVSIEHEGIDGDLTPEQFASTVWLERYIQQQVFEIWGARFELDPNHVIGHFMVNPVGKPFCPGPKFPWDRLYAELAKGEQPEMEIKHATILIGLAKAAWREGVTKIELEDGSMLEIHEKDIEDAADGARLASGQPVQ